MQQSNLALPPLVEGPVRGALRLSLGPLTWTGSEAPSQLRGPLQARILWWGDSSGGEVLRLQARSSGGGTITASQQEASLLFQLRTGPKYLTRYLRDMGCLTITIEAAGLSSAKQHAMPAATVLVGLMALDVQAPISGSYPLVLGSAGNSADGEIVGSLPVQLELDYASGGGSMPAGGVTAPLSSFELNEHLSGRALADVAANDADRDAPSMQASGEAKDAPPVPSAGNGLAGALGGPNVCTLLAAAMQDSKALSSALRQLASGTTHGLLEDASQRDAAVLKQDQLRQLLQALLPNTGQHELLYAAAMLLPFASSNSYLSIAELQAAAEDCCAVEHSLQQQPAAQATRCLRELAASLGSRSLDLAAAFAAGKHQQLPLSQLGDLLLSLHPSATTKEARCLLALLAGGGAGESGTGGITLPAIKAALSRVSNAQQFPTAEDLERQQAAVAARRAKEAAAAAAVVLANQRAAAALAADDGGAQPQAGLVRKKVAVNRLKLSQQERRSSSSNSSSQKDELATASAHAEDYTEPDRPQNRRQVDMPAVVGIPTLPGPDSTALFPLSDQQQLPWLSASTAAAGTPAEKALGEPLPAAAEHARAAALQPAPALLPSSSSAAALNSSGPVSEHTEQPRPAAKQAQADPLLQLIQQAEQLKAALERASGSRHASAAPSQLAELSCRTASRPRLPNLLVPQTAATTAAACSAIVVEASKEATQDGTLPAATAALMAAAQAVRVEADHHMPHQQPASENGQQPACALLAGAAAASTTASRVGALTSARAEPVSVIDSSDAESDAEDAILESLFLPPKQIALPAQPTDGHLPEAAARHSTNPRQQPHQQFVLRVQLQSLRLTDGGSSCSSVRCVVKPLCAGSQGQQVMLPVAAPGSAACSEAADPGCHVEVTLPAQVAAGQPGCSSSPQHLLLELWSHSGSLVGLAKVPLLQSRLWQGAANADAAQPAAGGGGTQQQHCLPAVVAEGHQAVRNVLEGKEAGSLYVAAVLQELGAPPHLPALRHSFSVRIRSAHRLPSTAAYAAAGLRAPDSRLLRYSFPGEVEALQTKEAPCCSNPSFDAAAQHEMVLPAGQSIMPLLQDGLLRFEVLDCWADYSQHRHQQHGWALLPLTELAGLVALAEASSSRSALGSINKAGIVREASKVLLLPLCTEYDSAAEAAISAAGVSGAAPVAAPPASRGPSIKIELSYAAQLHTMPAEEAATSVSIDTPHTHAAATQAAGSGEKLAHSSDSEEENSLSRANNGTRGPRRSQPPATSSGVAGVSSPSSALPLGLIPESAADAGSVQPEEPSVPATISVEIIRACGLAAAVREASTTSASGNSRSSSSGQASGLRRATTVGPNAFARLSLFPNDSKAQQHALPLQTPFVAQSFCPTWQAAHSYELPLTGHLLELLATESLRVEVWHRCPRALAGSGGQREVLLGAGSAPLLDVLRKPRGLQCWVPLSPQGSNSRSSSGVCVGAVQITVQLSALGGLPASSCSEGAAEEVLLLRSPEAATLLSPPLRPALLQPPGFGFTGQPAVVMVLLEALVPPSNSSDGGRPKADRFYCSYSLPGSTGSSSGNITTAARVLTALGSSGSLPSCGGSSRRGSRSGAVLSKEQPQLWATKLNHQGYFEVHASTALVAALMTAPLHVMVYKLPTSAGSITSRSSSGVDGSGASAAAAGKRGVLVGQAEVDLSSLLWPGQPGSVIAGSDTDEQLDEQRSVSGWYPLVKGIAASQGGGSLAATVQLQLQPGTPASEQAAAAAAAGVDACSGRWQLEAGGSMQQQPQTSGARNDPSCDSQSDAEGSELEQALHKYQRQGQGRCDGHHQAQAAFACSSDDEELLQRCCQLVPRRNGKRQHQLEERQEQPADADEGQLQQQLGEETTANTHDGGSACPQQSQQPPQHAQQGAGARDSGSVAATDQHLHDQQLADEEGRLLVEIDSALRLPAALPPGHTSGSSQAEAASQYCAFVQAAWDRQQPAQQRTHAVAVHMVEAGELAGTAVWGAELELRASAAAWAACASGSVGSGPSLLLHVWSTGGAAAVGHAQDSQGASDSLLGTAAVDLAPLLEQVSVRGWFPIVGSDQQQRGQLKAAMTPNSALRSQLAQLRQAAAAAAASPAAASAVPLLARSPLGQPRPDHQQGQLAAEQTEPEEQQESSRYLMQQLQAQLEGLDLLSRRLAAAPPAGLARPAGAVAAGAVGALPAAAQAAGLGGNAAVAWSGLAESEGEEDSFPPFDARQVGNAWSGSDSDEDDPLALLGVAFEGAVSPGYSDQEEEEAPRPPRRPAIINDEWMFSISRTGEMPAGTSQTMAAADASLSSPEADGEQLPSATRRLVTFRNVIPTSAAAAMQSAPAAVPVSLSAQQFEQQPLAESRQAFPQQGAAAASPAAPPAAAADVPAPASATSFSASAAQQPLPALSPDWMFDISRQQPHAPGSIPSPSVVTPAVTAPPHLDSTAACSQFAPMAMPPPHSTQGVTSSLQQQQQQAQAIGAATIDEVLQGLLQGRQEQLES